MKQRIENYIPKAIELVKKVKIANEENEVKNEFNGYFSAFGAAIIQSGLKPALAFYANEKTAKEKVQGVDGVIVGSTFVKHLIDDSLSNSEKMKKITQSAKNIKEMGEIEKKFGGFFLSYFFVIFFLFYFFIWRS